jgi:hypothetical protein
MPASTRPQRAALERVNAYRHIGLHRLDRFLRAYPDGLTAAALATAPDVPPLAGAAAT